MTYIGPFIQAYTYRVIGGCLRTSSKKELKGICLCKQATNVEDSSRTIVNRKLYYNSSLSLNRSIDLTSISL